MLGRMAYILGLLPVLWLATGGVAASVEGDTALSRFHACIANPSRIDMSCAMESVAELSSEEINFPIFGDRPILHHMMNLYMVTKDQALHQELLVLTELLIEKGANPNNPFNNDPDVVTKALIMREMKLALQFAEEGGAVLSSPFQLQTLFSLSCNPTPIAKMLLHADTILRTADPSLNLTANKLLQTATLQSASTRPLQNKHLTSLSSNYRDIISGLGNNQNKITKISLIDILNSVNDMVSGIFKELVMNHATATSSLSVTQDRLSRLLGSVVDSSGRNILHLLALSGSTNIIQDLQVIFDEAHPSVLHQLAGSLRAEDGRALSPVETAATRFGNSALLSSFVNLGAQCGAWPIGRSVDFFAKNFKVHMTRFSKSRVKHSKSEDSGGWSESRLEESLAGTGKCDILEMHEVPSSSADFFHEYVATGTPVVFRGAATQVPQFKKLIEGFHRDFFLHRHGNDFVNIAAIPYASSFGISGINANIAQIAHSEGATESESVSISGGFQDGATPQYNETEVSLSTPPLYAFTTAVSEAIRTDAEPPSFLHGIAKDVELQFYLGSAGSGAPPHFHGHAVNSLAFGEKVAL